MRKQGTKAVRSKFSSILIAFILLLSFGIPLRVPQAHAAGTQCQIGTSDCVLIPKTSNAFTSGAKMASEVRFDQSTGFSDANSVGYGGNTPEFWIGVEGGLSASQRSAPNPYYDLRTLQIKLSIKDSSGNSVPISASTLTASVWDTPYPTGINVDTVGVISDLSQYLIGLLGVSLPPDFSKDIQLSQPNGNYNFNPNTFLSQWTGYPNPCIIAGLSAGCIGGTNHPDTGETDKLLQVKVIPTFPSPDVYTINVSTEAEVGECYQHVAHDDQTGLSTYSFECGTAEAQTQSFSFKYVYENDAGNGTGDAADSPTGSVFSIQHGSYTGLLYGIDTADSYSFLANPGETVAFTETPPSSADFRLTIYNTDAQTIIQSVDNGIGQTSGVSFTVTAPTTGTYFAQIKLVSGWGTYSFTLSDTFKMSASPSALSLGMAGTASSTTSSITTSSVSDFSGQVTLNPVVSPNLPNGPSASINPVNLFAQPLPVGVQVSTSGSGQVWNPAFYSTPDSSAASFMVCTCSGGGFASATYSFSSSSLPSDAVITKIQITYDHAEQLVASGSLNAYWFLGSASSKTAIVPSSQFFTNTVDITPFSQQAYGSSWSLSMINSFTFQWYLSPSSSAGTTCGNGASCSLVDYIGLMINYNYPAPVLTAGSSDTRVLTVSSTALTPAGVYTVTVTGTGPGGITSSASVTASVQDFQLSASVTSLVLTPGQSTTTTISVAPLSGFTGTVALSVSAPGGFQTGFSTNPIIGGSGTSTLTITLTSTPSADPATITISGTSQGRPQVTSVIVTDPPAGFSIIASPSPVVATAGQSIPLVLTVTSLYGFSGTVSLNAYAPPGLNCSAPNPSSITLTSTVHIATSKLACSAPVGVYTLNVTGASGSSTNSTLVGFTFQDFSLSPSSLSASAYQGTQPSFTINVTDLSNITSITVSFIGTVSGGPSNVCPSGLTCPSATQFTPGTLTASAGGIGSTILTIIVPANSPCGTASQPVTYTVTVTGTSGPTTRTGTINLSVYHAGDVNKDGVVNITDLVLVASSFGKSSGQPGFNPAADLDGDGIINIDDLVLVGANFGATC